MNVKKIHVGEGIKKLIAFTLAVVLGLTSFFVFSPKATDPATYKETIQSIDKKKMTVLGVSVGITATATGLAAIPGDTTTPIADKMMDLGGYLAMVVIALVLEKSLLTVFGFLAFRVLIPAAVIFFCLYLIKGNLNIKLFAYKLAIFAAALAIMIPTSVRISDYIYEVNKTETAISEEQDQEVEITDEEVKGEKKKEKWYVALWNTLSAKISEGAQKAAKKAQNLLNEFVDTVSVFIIAYCIMPLLTVFGFLGLIKLIFGAIVPTPNIKEMNPSKYMKKGVRTLKKKFYKDEEEDEDD